MPLSVSTLTGHYDRAKEGARAPYSRFWAKLCRGLQLGIEKALISQGMPYRAHLSQLPFSSAVLKRRGPPGTWHKGYY